MTNDDAVLMDASYLIALANPKDKFRQRAVDHAKTGLKKQIVLDVVLGEVVFLLGSKVSYRAANLFIKTFTISSLQLESITKHDLERVFEIRENYADAKFNFVDCCIMALSERLEIMQICTFDRRDFSIFRPKHCPALELLP